LNRLAEALLVAQHAPTLQGEEAQTHILRPMSSRVFRRCVMAWCEGVV
jgi:hypothetical protein